MRDIYLIMPLYSICDLKDGVDIVADHADGLNALKPYANLSRITRSWKDRGKPHGPCGIDDLESAGTRRRTSSSWYKYDHPPSHLLAMNTAARGVSRDDDRHPQAGAKLDLEWPCLSDSDLMSCT
jgi:hypothetical protein